VCVCICVPELMHIICMGVRACVCVHVCAGVNACV